jgi:outer membrane protein OmpA-like peptidoglycan-associated protein
MMKTHLLIPIAGLLTLTACAVDPNAYGGDPNARARTGAITGALLGGALGASSDDDSLAKGVAGAIIGGALGGAIGTSLDKQAADLRAQMSGNTTVTNTGDALIVTMPQDILFATDSATLRPDLQSDLRAISSNLISYPNSTIQVVGHTDNTGEAAYNQDLSERRALAVAAVLRNAGVPAGRVQAVGRGEDQPVASNLTPEGKSQNRRVEIIIRPTGRS